MLVRQTALPAYNAIKYSPRGGRIVVRIEANSPDAVLEVRDSGPGFHKNIEAASSKGFIGSTGPAVVRKEELVWVSQLRNGQLLRTTEPLKLNVSLARGRCSESDYPEASKP